MITKPASNARAAAGSPPSADCPICAAPSPALVSRGGHWYHDCPACTHQFLDYSPPASPVADHYSDGYFSGGGDGYPNYLSERDRLVSRGLSYAKRIANLTGRTGGDLLDIGSAVGFLAKGFELGGWGVHGLEPSPAMVEHANGIERIPTTAGTLEAFETGEKFDLILLVQVIAHLEDPAAALSKLHSLLRPGGHLLIETWDSRSRAARYLKGGWHEYNPPSVLHAFSRRSLHTLGEQQGFTTLCSKLTIKSLQACHAKALLEHRYSGSRLFNSLVKPAMRLLPDGVGIVYPADDLFWSCLQKS